VWLPEDSAYALAWQEELDARCGGCGQPRDESMSADADGTYQASVLRCHACTAQHDKASGFEGDELRGLYFSVTGGPDQPNDI
jgi:hypothetical protein